MQTPVFFQRPLSIGDLLDWTIRIYRARFGKLILTTALLFVPIGLISGIFSGQVMTGYLNIIFGLIQNPEATPDEEFFNLLQQNESAFLGFSFLLSAAGLAATGVISLALTQQAIGVVRNEEISIGAGLRTGLRRFWAWVGMGITIIFAFFVVTVALVIIFMLLAGAIAFLFAGTAIATESFGGGSGSGVPEAVAVAGMIFGIICFYLFFFVIVFGPFLYLYSRWSVALPGMVDQGWGPIAALRNSWALTRGHFWRVFGYVLLIYLFYGVIYSALIGLALGLAALVVTSSTIASVVIYGIISALLPVLWYPIQTAAFVMLYFDLRVRNEGYDIELRIQQLEAEVQQTGTQGSESQQEQPPTSDINTNTGWGTPQ